MQSLPFWVAVGVIIRAGGPTLNYDSSHEPDILSGAPVGKSWFALILAVVEAVCVFTIMAAKAGLLVGSVAIFAAGWAKYLHRDLFRIPVLLLAILGSGANLYLVWRFFNLRNKPAAAWRKKSLPVQAKWRIAAVLALAFVTLAIAFTEIYIHRSLHHTIM